MEILTPASYIFNLDWGVSLQIHVDFGAALTDKIPWEYLGFTKNAGKEELIGGTSLRIRPMVSSVEAFCRLPLSQDYRNWEKYLSPKQLIVRKRGEWVLAILNVRRDWSLFVIPREDALAPCLVMPITLFLAHAMASSGIFTFWGEIKNKQISVFPEAAFPVLYHGEKKEFYYCGERFNVDQLHLSSDTKRNHGEWYAYLNRCSSALFDYRPPLHMQQAMHALAVELARMKTCLHEKNSLL